MSTEPGRRRGIVAAQSQAEREARQPAPAPPAPKRSKKPGKLSLPK